MVASARRAATDATLDQFAMRYVALLAVVTGAGGCGLISSDVTNFNLAIKDKSFTVDAASWDVTQAEADAFLSTSCAGAPAACGAAARTVCPMNCTGECSPQTQRCELGLDVSLVQSIDLLTEQPELKALNDEPVIKVTIDSVTWTISANTLNVDTPEMTVYVAPSSVLDPRDPAAVAIGTIDPVPAGTVSDGPQALVFTDNGRAELISIMSTFKTPFNVIVGSKLQVTSGQQVPTGKLDALIQITGHAGL